MKELVETTMAAERLTWTKLSRRCRRTPQAVKQFVKSLGTRKHRIEVLTGISLALRQEPGWLLGELYRRGLRK